MDRYEMLACELMQALDQHKKAPPIKQKKKRALMSNGQKYFEFIE